MASEFDLIQHYFNRPSQHTQLGIGDDAALISLSAGMELAVSTDMLVSGVHFFHDADARQLGWKSLAVNLSDMAAMGAQPKWTTLAIALPQADESWVAQFSEGFFACAKRYQVDLIGGDTACGPLTISVQIMGEVAPGKALKRSGAKAKDDIWVSGTLGGAAIALAAMQGRFELSEVELNACASSLNTPQPRVELGLMLQSFASSAIDISDGLVADLGHILERSAVGANIRLGDVPIHKVVSTHLRDSKVQTMALAGGDDYELCFTAAQQHHVEISRLSSLLAIPLTCIGSINIERELVVIGLDNEVMDIGKAGYDHFKS